MERKLATIQRIENLVTTVELFSGIGGFRIAADQLGLVTLFANDINPTSCNVYQSNFGGEGLFNGDITNLIGMIPKHDVLTGGFPCQPFSAAGKKRGTRDPRGTLFQSIVNIIKDKTPEYFILENVKRLLTMEDGAHFATILAALSDLDYWIEWRVLNAKDFGLAQNRERILICGRKITSRIDISEMAIPRLAELTELATSLNSFELLKSDPNQWKNIETHGRKFLNWGMAIEGKYFDMNIINNACIFQRVLLQDILETMPPKEYDLTESTLSRLANNTPVNKFIRGVEVISNQAGGARMGYTIFGVNGIAPTLTASTSRHYERYYDGSIYRRLTPIEYARLQGFPDLHCQNALKYYQYSLLGNAVPPPIVKWVMQKWLQDLPKLETLELPSSHSQELSYAE